MLHVKTGTHVRFMVRRDLPDVLRIEWLSWDEHGWSEDDFVESLKWREVVGIVAEIAEAVVGFMIYEHDKAERCLRLLSLAVDPAFRRQGVGTSLLDRMKKRLDGERKVKAVHEAHEGELGTHLFLKANGFQAIQVLRRWFGDEDTYLMEWTP